MVVPRLLGCIDGTERVSNFSSFWMAMAPSRLRWLKKVFCFLFMEKLGFRKVSERFLEGFCSAGLTVDRYEFPTLSIFIVVTYKPLARTQNPFAGGKNNIKQLLSVKVCLFPSYITFWLILYDRRQKLEFLIQSLIKIWKCRYYWIFPRSLSLGCLC